MKKVLCLIALIAATSVSAQPPDVPRSRHDGLVGSCGSCVPASDGVIHFRFSPGSGVVTETIGGNPTKRLNLIMQVRGSKKTTERPQLIDQVSTGINYNETTFGPHLYTPAWFNLFGVPVANAQCTATRSDFFTGGEASYVLVVTDDSSSILGLTEETTSITNNTASPSTFATLTDKFVDFITITCNVIEEETEADISFTAVAADATGVRLIDANDANDPIIRRSILPVADNDLRGFRLDGKTWAEDYSRYSDGRGVRLKFSKGVYADNGGTKAALTAANFVVYDSGGSSTTITINDVEHTADDPYVTIDINSAPAGAVIRLVSNGASTVKDIDDNELADGNFVASLEYDSNAPQVASITTDSSFTTAQQSRWTIVFDQPIHADTAIKENLCLTDRNGACAAADAAPTTPSIVSVIAGTADNIVTEGEVSTMTVVVNEGPGKSGGARSIEFRRNAILAGNLYIAEDYQTELRGQIQLTNRIGPVITVRDAAMRVNPNNDDNYLNYEITFTVTADEDVPDLDDPASYGLRRRFILSPDMPLSTGFTVNSSSIETIEGESSKRKVRIVYNATFNSAAIVQIARMVLVRASSTSLTDGDTPSLGPNYINRANVAVNIDAGEILDPLGGGGEEARVPNLNRPIITATAAGDAVVGSNARQYSGSFTVTVSDASNRVPGIGDPGSYVLLRKISGNNTLAAETGATLTAGKVTTKTAVINFSITLASLNAARKTEYFTLGIGTGDNLLDIYSNPSPIASGARISTGAASQANRVGVNARIRVKSLAIAPAANDGNAYNMAFLVSSSDADSDFLALGDIGDPTAYTLIHIPTSGSPIDLVTNNLITSSSGPNTPSGSSASLQYAVTFTDIADTQRTAGFTLAYAGNDKLLSATGDKPARFGNVGNTGVLSAGDRIDNRDAAIAARDTTAPYLTITNNPSDSVATDDGGATYTFNFTVEPSESVQRLAAKESYSLLVAPTEGDIANDNLTEVDSFETTLTYVADNEPAKIKYQITLSDVNSLLGEANDFVPYGFLLARKNNAFRDASNNDPVQVDADGNPTTTTLSSDDTVRSVLQLGKAAVLEVDQDAPTITLAVDGSGAAVPVNANRFGEQYRMTFTVSADEPVKQIGDINSYTLMRVHRNNTVAAVPQTGVTFTSTENSSNPADDAAGRSASFTYTVTFRRDDAADDLQRIRVTQGFTLALKAGKLQDAANNRPVNANDEEIYDSSNALQRQGIIPPIPSNAAPSVMAARDTTAPVLVLGVTKHPDDSSISVGIHKALPDDDDPTVYKGGLTVSSRENIRDIHAPEAYQLLRIPTGGGAPIPMPDATISIVPTPEDGRFASVLFADADVGELSDLRRTRGFALAMAAGTDRPDGTRLRDYSQNNAVVINTQNQLSSVVLEIEKTAPVITVEAVDADGDGVFAEPTTTDGSGSGYTMTFVVTANEDVPTLNNTASYNLAGIDINDGTTVTIVQNNVTPVLEDGHTTTKATIAYTVTGITNPTSLAGFTLLRNGAESLRDKSGNLPAVNDGARIDSDNAAIAYRDRTPPRLTVVADGTSPKAVPSADGTAYSMRFIITSTEFLMIPGDTEDRYSLASIDTSSSATITNLNIEADHALITSEDKITLPFSISGITNPTNIKAFTLVRDNALMVDFSGNPVVRHDGTAIAVGDVIDDRDAALADRDTTPPQISVTGMAATADENGVYTVRFTVEATEPVKDLDLATSYRLFRVEPLSLFLETITSSAPMQVTADREYTIEFTAATPNNYRRRDVRDIIGYTLGRGGPSGSNVFIDRSGNSPVKVDGTTSISNNPDPSLISQNIIGANVGTTVETSAISLRDTTPPQLTVTGASSATIVSVIGDDITFGGTFTVTADEDILGIGLASSYKLIRVLGDNSTEDITTATLMNGANANSDNAEISYDATIRSQDVEDTAGFTLVRADNATASDSLIDYASNIPVDPGDTSNQINSAGERLDSRASAISLIDTSAPDQDGAVITLTADTEAVPDDDNRFGEVYDMTFTVEASEDVTGIGDIDNYTLMRVKANNIVETAVISGDPNAIRVSSSEDSGNPADAARETSATFTYTVTFRRNNDTTDLARIRDTKGFTLALATGAPAAGALQNVANNPPVNTDGEEIYNSSDVLQRQGLIPPKPSNAAPEVIAARDRTAPTARYVPNPAGSLAQPNDDDPTIYSGSFTVTSTVENIRDIGTPGAYTLRRVRKTGGIRTLSGGSLTLTSLSDNDANRDGMSAIINFSVDVGSLADARETLSFILQPNVFLDDGTRLRDYSNNNVDLSGVTMFKDTTDPVITVRAVGADANGVHAQPTTTDGSGSGYTMKFRVTADEEVPTLNNTASYNLVGIDIDDGSTATIVAGATITPAADTAGSSRATTLTYTVTGITNPTDLAGFTLVRNGAESLRDKSGNLPNVADGARIDSNAAAIAARDTTPPRLTVVAQGTSPKAMPTRDDGTAYSMRFLVSSSELVAVDLNNLRYRLASVDTSTSATITNLNTEYTSFTNPGGTNDPTLLTYNRSGITDPTNIKAFTLVRRQVLVKDYSGNTAVRHDGTAIAVGDVIDDRDAALADRDTTPPQITVTGMPATVDENGVYTARFTVNATEPVKDLNRESSYELLNTSFDDGVGFSDIETSDFTEVTANERYTVEFTSNNFASLRRSLIRNNKGFTLARKGNDNVFIDRSGNSPVKGDGTTSISNDPTGDLPNSIIGAVTGFSIVADAAISLRDNIPPQITVTGTTATIVSVSGNDVTLSGTFTVTATEPILNIGLGSAYLFIDVYDADDPSEDGASMLAVLSDGANLNSDRATIPYTITFSGPTVIQDLRTFVGFTLARADNATASNNLIDYASNIPVDPGDTSNQINSVAERLDSRASAISPIDTRVPDQDTPIITVRAIDIAGATGTDSDGVFAEPSLGGDGSRYTMAFKVTANKEVPTLNTTASYSLAGVSISDGSLVAIDQSNVTPTVDAGGSRATTLTYTVTGITNPTSLAGFTLVRNGAESLVDESGNQPSAADGARIDSDNAAIAARDTTPPQITVSAMPATVDASGNYTLRFTVSATEDVKDLNLATSYRLLSISNSNSVVEYSPRRSPNTPTEVTANREYTIQYSNVNPITDSNSSRDILRNRRGFTIGRLGPAGSNVFIDRSGNSPVKADGTTSIANDDFFNSIIGPITVGTTVADAAVSAIEKTPPQLTVTDASSATIVSVSGNEITFGGTFTVTADEDILGIGLASSYKLIRVLGDNSTEDITTATLMNGANANSDNAEISYDATIRSQDVEDTAGFTLARADDATASDILIDYASNIPVDPGDTSNQINSAGERLDSRASAVSLIDTAPKEMDQDPPTITVRAIDIEGDFGADNDGVFAEPPYRGNGSQYNLAFRVTADEEVPSLNSTASYSLAAVSISNDSLVAIDQSNVTAGVDVASDSRATTLNYTVTGVSDPTSLAGFTLVRSGAESLVDRSGNPPAVADGARIDSNDLAIAYRDRTPPTITITAQGSSPKAEASADGTYTMTFGAVASEFVYNEDVQNIYDLATVDLDSAEVVPLNISTGETATASFDEAEISYTNITVTDLTNIAGFTLVLQKALTDYSGNPLVYAGTTKHVVVGTRIDDRDAALADIEREQDPPTITVRAIDIAGDLGSDDDGVFAEPAITRSPINGRKYTLAFKATADEDVPTLNNTTSYSLAGISISDGNIATIDQNNVTPVVDEASDSRATTLSYTVTGISDPTSLAGFTLIRSGSESLVDRFGNPPAVADGARIDSDNAAIAYRDTTPPRLTVTVKDESPKAKPIAPNDGTAYRMIFTVRADEPLGISSLGIINTYLLASVSISNPPTITNLNIKPGATSTMTEFDPFDLTFEVFDLTDPTDIKAFTLVRGATTITDFSGNPFVAHDGATIAVGDLVDNRDAALADRDTVPPFITVLPSQSQFARIDDQVCGSFSVSGNEAIDGINSTASYSLLRIDPDGTVSELTDAGGANARCEGHGSVISHAIPTTTTAVLNATIHFNVVDSEVTTAHKYTLGRKESLTDISGNPLVDTVDKNREITATADANGRIDSRSAALGDIPIPSADTTPPIITATVQDTDGDTSDMVEAVPDANNPLSFSGRFRVVVQQPDGEEENVARIGEEASYQVVYISITNNQEVAISNQTITISNVTVNRAATVSFTAVLPNIAAVQDVAAFKLKPVDLVDSGGNAPLDNEFADTNLAEDVDSRLARRDRTAPAIKVVADSAAEAQADDGTQYRMTFTVSAVGTTPEDVRDLDDTSSYRLMRVGGNPFDLTVNSVTTNTRSNKRSATFTYTATVSSGIESITGFTLARASATDSLIDRSGNAPVKGGSANNGSAIAVNGRIDDDNGAVATRERMPPRITITAVDQAATADANDNYTMQFTVSANEAVATLGSASSYGVRRIDNDNNLRSDANATASNPEQVTANRQYKISYTANLSGLSATERRNTKGFTLVRVGTSRLIDRSGNPPVKADGSTAIANGAVIAAVTNNVVAATAVAARETARPRIEVRPVNVGGFGAVPHATLENTYEGSFTVRSVSAENIKGLGATASYTLQQVLVVGSNNTAQPTMEITSSSDSSATVSVTIGFQATFTGTQAEIDEAVRSTDGFTLSAGSLSLTDYASNLPQGISNVGDRLDTSDNAVAKVDRRAPRIKVVAGNDGNAVADETDPLVYTGSFTVTAPADKPITGLATTASYKVLRISLGDRPFDVDNATIIPQGTGDETVAMFAFTATLADIKTVQKTKGFTLGYLANLRDSSGIIPQQFGGGRLDDREAAIARVSLVRVECAPFYPNIGQQDLFFKVTSESEPNLNGLTLTQGGTTLFNSTDTAVLMEGSEGEFAILKARVSSEITDSAPISVSYADAARTVQTSCAIDNLANLTDSDGDGVIDIVDSNPYDSSVTAINDTVASASLAATPASTDTFYNRRVLVRSLLRGNEFTYVEGGEIKMAGVTALTAAEYFGIDYAAKTHLLAVESDSDCALILAAAQENKLSQVNLAAFCASEDLGVAEEYDFVDKVSITESQRYVWVGVDSAGRLKPSEYPDHTISALPEINISGQSSYFYTEPPAMPKNIIISAYAPDATNTSITVTVKGTVVSGDPIADEKVVLQRYANSTQVFVGPKVYSGIHSVTGSGKNPQAGQTIRHWLIGDTLAATINVWHATEAKLTLPTSGGYTIFDDAKYAIGDYSHVDVRMAKDGSSEPITEIHQLLLYDVTETTVSRVTSAVQGREYYLIADLTTNIENIGDEVLVAMPQGGYTIRTMANVVIRNNIGNSGHLIEQESFELIAFRVNSDAGDTISVGWDKIGTAENIVASYRVTADIPLNYNLPGSDHGDRDGDRILDDLDRLPDWPFSLPVAVDNEIRANDWLGAVAWYDQPLYVSDEGLIIAAAKANDKEINYSAANIDYSGLTTDTRTQLGFTDDDSITSLATFGIRSVDYGFSQEANADAMVSGGIAYAVFPIEAGMPDQPLYISRYNEEAGRWERFERGTHRDGYADTWYVIDREMINGESTYCPLDVGVYRNEHMTAGEDDMGFTANNQKCVLVAITDGGPYDNSGINGRIDALLAIGTQLQSPALPSQGLQCAAFYANVGQKELFFELNGIGFDANGFAIAQGGNSLDVDSALQINTDAMDGVDPIVKLTLIEEIVSLADIRVTYTADGEPSETMCVASLKEDTDDDGVADIVDNNPFDADDMKPNPDITGPPSDNDDLFVESDIFYSRDVVVRSLLRGEAFTYIEEDENDKPIRMTHTGTMTPAEYFGVDADARIYEYSEMCEAILATAQANGLSQVRLDEFCTEDISDDFVDVINNDFVEKGSDGHRYLWATVRGGFLVSSYIGESIRILPEINFLGQDTYLFAGPTTKTVIISAYVSHVGAPTQISVKGASTDEDNDFSDSEEVTLMGTNNLKDRGTILSRDHDITSHGEHPGFGETNIRWLSAPMDATNIWQPKGETLMTQEGGHDFSGYRYAIGTHNNIDVRVADPEKDDPITEIRQVLLYEVTDSDPPIRRVTSMVAGKTYYVAVDFDTNIADEEIEIEPAVQHMALYTITTATHHVARVRDAGHLEKEEVAIIVITVDDDISTDTAVITVGWTKVGSVNNVISRYLVKNKNTDPLLDYALVDADLDGIPDSHLGAEIDKHGTTNTRLQVAIGIDTDRDIDPDRDFLATQDEDRPTFLTYEGLVIADALNNDGGIKGVNYSVVNNGDLSSDTQLLLDIEIDDTDEIDTIATFGVAGVEYGFELEGNRARLTGGVVYASFPLVVVDPSLNGETLYLGKYDYATGSWVRFERGTVVTWYAINRPDVGACPTDVQVYQNQHQAVGDEGMGFTAGPTGNCIMLVLSDGVRLYDSSSLDGRVLDPLSIGTKLFDKAREQPSQPHRRGGGGAIGVSDILLLIGALVLITVASRKRRKAQ